VESLPELENINRIAAGLKKRTNVALRINPDVEAKTHKYITTGKLTNKFGIDFVTASNILSHARELTNININGVHIHIGSQITISTPFVEAIKKVVAFIKANRAKGADIEYLNIGGGLGIVYSHEVPQTAEEFAAKVCQY